MTQTGPASALGQEVQFVFYSNTDGDCIFPIGRVLTSQSLRLAGFKRLSVEEMKERDELLQTVGFQDYRELFA